MSYDITLAKRPNKVVYKDGDTVLKIFNEDFSKSDVLNEALNQSRVEETGLHIPKVLEVMKIDGKWAIRTEYVPGKTLQQLIDENPDKKDEYRGIFPHKTGAVLSGLGFIGKNGLLITEYGSAVRLASVLTDMPLSAQKEIKPCLCGDCQICKNACPAGAITGELYVNGAERSTIFDAKKCSEHMKTYKNIGRGAVCGICISVCPYNK